MEIGEVETIVQSVGRGYWVRVLDERGGAAGRRPLVVVVWRWQLSFLVGRRPADSTNP